MKKIIALMFVMMLFTISCKAKSKPSGDVNNTGNIEIPKIGSQDEQSIIDILNTQIPGNYDDGDAGWQNSDWKNVDTLKGKDLSKITNGGFFVAQYFKDSWLVFAISSEANNERNIYVGISTGYDKLQHAIDMMANQSGKLNSDSWDPRKLVYNHKQHNQDDLGQLSIAWLGRARWDWRGPTDKRYKGYDALYPNAITALNGIQKTYSTLRIYQSEKIEKYLTDPDLKTRERNLGLGVAEDAPIEEANGEDRRKVWGVAIYGVSKTRYHNGNTQVSTPEGMRFAYATKDGGYTSGIGTKKGSIATPGYITDGEKTSLYSGDGYDTREPKGKIVFYRTVPEESANGGAKVQFLTTAVAYNIRMRESQLSGSQDLFGGEYNVMECVFEFDESSFSDIADEFSGQDLPIREKYDGSGSVAATYEITGSSTIKTHKVPLLYFSPK